MGISTQTFKYAARERDVRVSEADTAVRLVEHGVEALHELLPDDEIEPLATVGAHGTNVTVAQVLFATPNLVLVLRKQLCRSIENEWLSGDHDGERREEVRLIVWDDGEAGGVRVVIRPRNRI